MIWDPLRRELDAWQERGRIARFWLRDDDAIAPSPALTRLASITAKTGAVLAVIPAFANGDLAAFVAGKSHLRVAVHGWSHANHAPPSEKKQELGSHRSQSEVLSEVRRGLAKLQTMFGEQLLPMLVPPWNRIDASLLPGLGACGFTTLSIFGPARPDAPIPMINTHVDVIDWRGTRKGRDHAVLVDELVRELQRRRPTSDEPLGILSHHRVNDGVAFRFIEDLLSGTAAHPACHWLKGDELLKSTFPLPLVGRAQ